ncbi:hypothetical protein NQZ68_025850 [Dissostichus eleginoides]|nr:hypothetical protein NQZ68_025850 [Dissostichus eleginoides]
MQVLLGAQQISVGVPGVKAAWADTLDRDLLLPECQANEVRRGRLGSLSETELQAATNRGQSVHMAHRL